MIEDYELMLFDRLNVIKDTVAKYGEDKFYISFSGGKDSTVLHYLVDMALPNNKIPRVYANTGIDLIEITKFVKELADNDERIIMIKPSLPVKETLEKYGYPFKSKLHSYLLEKYQRLGMTKGVMNYLGLGDKAHLRQCPKVLRYQFTEEFTLKISDQCCKKMKEDPLTNWAKENNKSIAITGVMRAEGGRRSRSQCFVKVNNHLSFFNPLSKVDENFNKWLIEKYNLRICKLYYPPYNFVRTGCKGCPFALNLKNELKVLEEKIPYERKQCEIIWKPVYDEYRRIGYRIKELKK